jgi:general stress protein 26
MRFVVQWVAGIGMLLCMTTSFQGQRTTAEKALAEEAHEIMTAARYCTLITLTLDGQIEARTMDPLVPDANLTVWLATNPLSQKVVEIRSNPKVTLHYFDPDSQAYVSLQGTARIVTDQSEKRRHWKEEWKPFYLDRDKGLVLISFTPTRLEVVNIAKGILGDTRHWQPPSVVIKR